MTTRRLEAAALILTALVFLALALAGPLGLEVVW